MLDPKLLRQDIQSVKQQLQRKHFQLDDEAITRLEDARKSIQVDTQALQNKRNVLSKQIGQAKAKGESTDALFKQVAGIGDELKEKEATLQTLQVSLTDQLSVIPNLLHADVPAGKDEADNQLLHRWGEPREFDFEVKDHVSLGESLGGMDFSCASKISGSRFVVLQGKLARLHRALAQFMLDVHVQEHGYQECYVPYLVNSDSLIGTGQLSKFQEGDQFHLKDDDLWLIPTSEVPLTNIARDVIYEESDLPIKLTAHTPCFRREAGSYGKDTRGMIRQHQFEKVEMVQLVRPDKSYEALESLTKNAEAILQKLNLPYQCVRLCGGDTGFSAAMTYDLEVWLPGQQAYREISSCSNMEAFQARRIHARYRDKASGKPVLLHTLNGSGLAVGRTLVALMENYQQADGSIAIPDALQPYVGGQTNIQ